jgi:ribosomal-protein-alanine N-acetyltransferase
MSSDRVAEVGVVHATALAAIHAAAFPPAEAWSASLIASQLAQPGVVGFAHADGGMMLARIAADEAEILTLAVAPTARRRGIGSGLLHAAMAEARRRDAVTMTLEVDCGNVAAVALYTRHGFANVARRPRYYPGGSDAIVMQAMLTRPAAAGDA